jgi:hypothetical protein
MSQPRETYAVSATVRMLALVHSPGWPAPPHESDARTRARRLEDDLLGTRVAPVRDEAAT